MNLIGTMLAATALGVVSTAAAHATIVTVFDDIAGGRSAFDLTVAAAGGTVDNDVWGGLSFGTSIDRGDYVITRNGGGSLSPTTYGTMSGEVVSIDPAGGGSYPRTDPMDYFNSGVTLTFGSAVNAVGFEVGDWATCCLDPTTDLYISFDGGAPILVASADDYSDGLFPSQTTGSLVNEIFVAAFDDSGDFTSVSFWGNGIGEYLVFGGDVRYALLDQGSLPPDTPAVPLPAGGLLLLGALGGMAALRRRKQA
ncbi:MAG: VPLPA-CTERM sorting domain-containing protein [Rhodobacteraceae bacterium]|nr:VPLPA-CTERM sorting domain-containing protein [Paracoccaceae bacterium]